MKGAEVGAKDNWLGHLRDRAQFYRRRGAVSRRDGDFDWGWYASRPGGRLGGLRRLARAVLNASGLRSEAKVSIDWLNRHRDALWETRCLFGDAASRLQFDEHLVLKVADHQHQFFPREEFEDLLEVLDERDFDEAGLPRHYLGLPLHCFRVRSVGGETFEVVTTRLQMDLLNRFHQYVPVRDGVDLGPAPGETVIDCGACIGEVSIYFAARVGAGGAVHLFDPVPLHTGFCAMQARLNDEVGPALVINTLAVSDVSHAGAARPDEGASAVINPAAIPADAFPTTTIDAYRERLAGKVDFIKMDIEGAEASALRGAARTIAGDRPRLAISAYHRDDDLWELPRLIRELRPDYRFAFGHHSPIHWESVLYAY